MRGRTAWDFSIFCSSALGGAIVGAFAPGFLEVMWSGYFTGEWRDAASFGALTFLLIMRPNGLFSPTLSPDERV